MEYLGTSLIAGSLARMGRHRLLYSYLLAVMDDGARYEQHRPESSGHISITGHFPTARSHPIICGHFRPSHCCHIDPSRWYYPHILSHQNIPGLVRSEKYYRLRRAKTRRGEGVKERDGAS